MLPCSTRWNQCDPWCLHILVMVISGDMGRKQQSVKDWVLADMACRSLGASCLPSLGQDSDDDDDDCLPSVPLPVLSQQEGPC